MVGGRRWYASMSAWSRCSATSYKSLMKIPRAITGGILSTRCVTSAIISRPTASTMDEVSAPTPARASESLIMALFSSSSKPCISSGPRRYGTTAPDRRTKAAGTCPECFFMAFSTFEHITLRRPMTAEHPAPCIFCERGATG